MTFTERMQQEDKTQHIICAFLAVVLLLLMMPLYWALGLVFATGMVKEGWDAYMGTGFCWYDIAANGIGIALAAGLMAW
jgi:hypothetical protein